ncbi:MAG: hypothetical protein V4629_01495 [Pseudomonadota bacterium]
MKIIVIMIFIVCGLALVSAYIIRKKLHIWLPAYCINLLYFFYNLISGNNSNSQPNHICVLFVDHFELNGQLHRQQAWFERYADLAKQHTDADGCYPKHTFFYALDLLHEEELAPLQKLVEAGHGEVELHWHHGHQTEQSFNQTLSEVMPIFQSYGFMKPYKTEQRACFAFIHGNWSLDNSRGNEFCGLNNEIDLLKQWGCYADFTFPALFQAAQPAYINCIRYAKDDAQPKSYRKAREAEVGKKSDVNEFMIFQGPLTINWFDWRHKWHPTFEDADIHTHATHADPKRIEAWLRQKIHVKGRPEWQFVKLFCHGAQDYASVVGPATHEMWNYLEKNYNDGTKYVLHYVTAREAYNIVRAAEDGLTGNPNQYRDYVIPHPNQRK